MIKEFIKAFLLIFSAEIGDKSQIIAMTFATQYTVKEVLTGVSLGVLLNHGIAILLGSFISFIVPMELVQIIAGFLFIFFGIKALSIEDEEENDESRIHSPILTVATAFFIGELGDKTQLTAMTLSAESSYPSIILLGTVMGMITTSAFGIFIGSKIGDRIPEVLIKILSSLVFVIFGIVKLLDTIPKVYLSPINITVFILMVTFIEIELMVRLRRKYMMVDNTTPLKRAAEILYKQTNKLKDLLDSICIGEDTCGTCSGVGCLLGNIRFLLREARQEGEYHGNFYIDIDKLIKKNYDKSKIIDALSLIIEDFKKYGWEYDEDFIVVKIKKTLELYLFNRVIAKTVNTEEYIRFVKQLDPKIGKELKEKLI